MAHSNSNSKYYSFWQAGYGISVSITKEQAVEMQELAKDYFPDEFGGILIGKYAADFSEAFIEGFLTTSKIKNSSSRFTRYAQELNQKLDQVHRQSGGETHYLGEWHSHPIGQAIPSHIDKKAMTDIANDPKIETSTPILLIMGNLRQNPELSCYIHKLGSLLETSPEKFFL